MSNSAGLIFESIFDSDHALPSQYVWSTVTEIEQEKLFAFGVANLIKPLLRRMQSSSSIVFSSSAGSSDGIFPVLRFLECTHRVRAWRRHIGQVESSHESNHASEATILFIQSFLAGLVWYVRLRLALEKMTAPGSSRGDRMGLSNSLRISSLVLCRTALSNVRPNYIQV